jgi:serine/threonine protein kinase
VIVYLVYKYLKEHGFPSINIKTTAAHGGEAELTSLLPDSTIHGATIENFLNEITREKHIRFTSQQLNGYTQHMSAELGAGGFGVVYKGMLPNGLDIAVKVLHEKNVNEVTEQQFMAEVGTLWRTNHANLIRLIGYCYDGSGMQALVYEFMANGSLDKYLFDRRRMVGSSELLAIAVGVARGLRYLHEECQRKIIHYDVKASNVLLDDSLTPKLTDFGLAQLLSRADAHASVHVPRGTVGYMAREVIDIDVEMAAITDKCDVYSFGMLLFEVISRRKIIDNSLPESEKWLPLLAWNMYQQGKLLDLMKKYHNPIAAEDEGQWKETAERMCKVAFLCVQEQPKARPTMSMVVNMLEGHLEIPPPEYPLG